jgi:hypothetical protein
MEEGKKLLSREQPTQRQLDDHKEALQIIGKPAPEEVSDAARLLARYIADSMPKALEQADHFSELTFTWTESEDRLSVALVKPGMSSPVELLDEHVPGIIKGRSEAAEGFERQAE